MGVYITYKLHDRPSLQASIRRRRQLDMILKTVLQHSENETESETKPNICWTAPYSVSDMEAARPVDVIHAVNEDIPICEANIRGACLAGLNCPLHHYHTPYLWQAQISNNGNQMWSSLTAQNEKIEDFYSSPWNKECTVEVFKFGF